MLTEDDIANIAIIIESHNSGTDISMVNKNKVISARVMAGSILIIRLADKLAKTKNIKEHIQKCRTESKQLINKYNIKIDALIEKEVFGRREL